MASEQDKVGHMLEELVPKRLYVCRITGNKVLYLDSDRGLTVNSAGEYVVVKLHDRMLKSVHDRRP